MVSGSNNAPAYKISKQSYNAGRVTDDLENFSRPISQGPKRPTDLRNVWAEL